MVNRWVTSAVGFLCAFTLAATAQAAVPQGFVGMNVDGPLYPSTAPGVDIGAQMTNMVAAGVDSIRIVIDWSYAQPYADMSDVPSDQAAEFTDINGVPTRFAEIDQIVELAAEHGLTVLPTVLYTPGWDAEPHPFYSFAIPNRPAPYANFLTDLVHRYGPGGTFWQTHSPALPIHMWQIWNEPNINVFWFKQPFQPTYLALLKAAHDAIKRADPRAKVVLAGLPNYSWRQLAKIYKYRGAAKLFDVVAVHPYTADPEGVLTILNYVREAMDKAGDTHKPIIADELSWPSSLGKTTHNEGLDIATTEAGQARKIAALLPLLGQERRSLNLIGFYYYTWAGLDDRNGLTFDFSGLFHFGDGVFTPKPAYSAFRHAALALEQCRKKGLVASVCSQPG
jgi:hypothetical protein